MHDLATVDNSSESSDGIAYLVVWCGQVAKLAAKLEAVVTVILVLGLCAVASIGIKLYAPDSPLWWNLLKLALPAIPLLIWFVFWLIIKQLADAPQALAQLSTSANSPIASSINQLRQGSFKQPRGLFSLLSSMRQVRNTPGLEDLVDALGGIALLANPWFALLVVLALLASIGTMLLAPIIWLVF